MPARPLDFGTGASLIGDEEAAAVEKVIRSRSLFRYDVPDLQGTVAAFEADAAVSDALGIPRAAVLTSSVRGWRRSCRATCRCRSRTATRSR